MSRVIIQNLHKRATEKELLASFGSYGQVTDVQLKYTKHGVFRGFAFVGYREQNGADSAIEGLDGTFIGGTKVSVSHCHALGSDDKPRGWSKYSIDSSAFAKLNPKPAAPDKSSQRSHIKFDENCDFDKLAASDDKFREYLAAHGVATDTAQHSGHVWSDMPQAPPSQQRQSSPARHSTDMTDMQFLRSKMKSDDTVDDCDTLASNGPKGPSGPKGRNCSAAKQQPASTRKFQLDFTVKLTNLPPGVKNKKFVRGFLAPLKPKSLRIPPKIGGIAFVGFLTEKEMNLAINKHRTYHEGVCVEVRRHVERKHGSGASMIDEHSLKNRQHGGTQDSVLETGRIFVRNLPLSTSEEDLDKLFSQFGELAELHMPVDRHSRKLKGFAFVGFLFAEHAEKAFSALDGSVFLGRMLHLIPARPKTAADQDGDEVGSNYKANKEKQLKSEAAAAHNWNALFLGANTVAELVADRYDTSKQQVLSCEKGSAAVRLALGETQLVTETRQFLLEHGVRLDAFAQPAGDGVRSKRVILVKNLPPRVDQQQLRAMFAKFGQLQRFVLPPSAVTALVEFAECSEARAAFRGLAYRRVGSVPLYLEWAPCDALSSAPVRDGVTSQSQDTTAASADVCEAGENSAESAICIDRLGDNQQTHQQQQQQQQHSCVLIVKNLHADTSDEDLMQHFAEVGSVESASVSSRHSDASDAGYGLVTFSNQQAAVDAVKLRQNSLLHGNRLQLKLSRPTKQLSVKTQRIQQTAHEQKSAKIVVKNVPFQASQREISELFQAFGELKAVRMPRKLASAGLTGEHRGFAFVEFNTTASAKRAMAALCASTHLYGRRLVLDWAQADDDVDLLRCKTAAQFSQSVPSKKRFKMGSD